MDPDDRVVAYVRRVWDREQDLPTIRRCARGLRMREADVLESAESTGLNINIGIQVDGGIGVFERIGDYTLEDLTQDTNPVRWDGHDDSP